MSQLNRTVKLPYLVAYGVGTMIGAGFYALLGEVAAEAGLLTPLAFLFSGTLALLTALSYSEMVARFPVSAGEVRFVQAGFDNQLIAKIVGLLVVATGIVSAATLSVATTRFIQDFVEIPLKLGVFLIVLALGLIAAWGIGKSVAIIAVIAVIEFTALLYAGFASSHALRDLPARWTEFMPTNGPEQFVGVFAASFLAFYAFIGFEDMVNIAEEVKTPRKSMPIAILLSMAIATSVYVVVSFIAVLAVPPEQLANSRTPIAELVRGNGWYATTGVGLVSILAGINGAIVQVIMASRVIYGMADRNQAPKPFAKVHPKTQTPLLATGLITGLVLLFALFVPLVSLAKLTSAIILVVFGFVNFSLWRLKRKELDQPRPEFQVPKWIPLIGCVSCAIVLVFEVYVLMSS